MVCTDTLGDRSLKSSSRTEWRRGFTGSFSAALLVSDSHSCIDKALATGWHGRPGWEGTSTERVLL